MRVAVVFGLFSDRDRDKRPIGPFVRASSLSAITIANPHRAVTINLRSVIPQPDGSINIGAVGYPYSKTDHHLSIQEVRSTKSGKVNYKSAYRTANGVPVCFDVSTRKFRDYSSKEHPSAGVVSVPIDFDYATRKYKDADGTEYPYEFVSFRYYNSVALESCRQDMQANKPVKDPGYLAWMEDLAAKNKGHVLDIGLPIGRAMADVLRTTYLDKSMPITPQIEFPDFFVNSAHPIEYDNDILNQDILAIARSPVNRLQCERPPFEGYIEKISHNGESTLVDFQKVSRSNTPSGVIFKAMDSPQTIEIPDPNKVVQVNNEASEFKVGDQVPPWRVTSPLKAAMRVIPYDPSYSSVAEIEERCGKALVHFVRQQLITQSTPVIRGAKSVLIRYIKKMPPDFTPNNVWTRSEINHYLYDLPFNAYVGSQGRIKYDLIHHPWFDSSAAYHASQNNIRGARVSVRAANRINPVESQQI